MLSPLQSGNSFINKNNKMKTIKLLVVGLMLMLAGSAQSQLSVNLHIGTPPAWGPAGYSDVRYYYLPDVEAYYDVQTSMFIYVSGNQWVRRSYLPTRYRNYDLYHGYKVVMNDYRGNSPYSRFKEHKVKYGRGYRGEEQRNVGERNGRQTHQSRSTVVQHERTVFRGNNSGRPQQENREPQHENDNEKNRNKNSDKGNDNRR
jgi:hypothetical protein